MISFLLFGICTYSFLITGAALITTPEVIGDLRYINRNTDKMPAATSWAEEEAYAHIRAEAEKGRVSWSRIAVSMAGYIIDFHVRPIRYARRIWHGARLDPLARSIQMRIVAREVAEVIQKSIDRDEQTKSAQEKHLSK